MFTYFQCYNLLAWKGYEKCGFINDNTGIRFVQSKLNDDSLKFNTQAAIGSELNQLILSGRYPLLIDRLQGGAFYDKYPYSAELIEHYRAALGEKFFGLQMHEWASNYLSDLNRIRECEVSEPWTEQSIRNAIDVKYGFEFLYLEAQTAEDYAKTGYPNNFKKFISMAGSLFADRASRFCGDLTPCDSGILAYNIEIRNGVKHIMPEVGAQTPNTRVQIAYARGMSRAKGIDFGIYYEPWGGAPFSTCNFKADGWNEWGIKNGSYGPYPLYGANGGSSRSLQRRLQLYAYFAGAAFICEEYGLCNTFYDWNDFELTPYGRIKADILRMTQKYGKDTIGSPYTPVALVLSKNIPFLCDLYGARDKVFGFDMPEDMRDMFESYRNGIRKVIAQPCPMSGNETRALINSTIPDAVDIIHEDCAEIYGYEYFINCTGNSQFEKNHRCCEIDEVEKVLKKLLPCTVYGNAHWLVNKTDTGWLLIIFNHSGIYRSVEAGEKAIEDNTTVKVMLKNGRRLIPLEYSGNFKVENNSYLIEIPAGEWFLGMF